ncbi:hypothetical protein [Kitasatospora sp. MMS16-BH015]|nr:hypothetical protein [Kitasatospora sp. MMS16-BH015]
MSENAPKNTEQTEPAVEETEETPEVVGHSGDGYVEPCGTHNGSCVGN